VENLGRGVTNIGIIGGDGDIGGEVSRVFRTVFHTGCFCVDEFLQVIYTTDIAMRKKRQKKEKTSSLKSFTNHIYPFNLGVLSELVFMDKFLTQKVLHCEVFLSLIKCND
jgi:hypothetical protein